MENLKIFVNVEFSGLEDSKIKELLEKKEGFNFSFLGVASSDSNSCFVSFVEDTVFFDVNKGTKTYSSKNSVEEFKDSMNEIVNYFI